MAEAWRDSGPPLPVDPDYGNADHGAQLDVLGVGRGWTSHVVRTGQFIETVSLKRFGPLVSPLTRSMIEHVVSIAWLVEQRETAIAVLRKMQYDERQEAARAKEASRYRLYDEASAAWFALIEPQLGEAERSAEKYSRLRHQAELTDQLDSYQLWLAETTYSHARLETAGVHVHLDAHANRYVDHKPNDAPNYRLYQAADLMFNAIYQYHLLLGDGSFERELHGWLTALQHTRVGVNDHIRESVGDSDND